MALNFELTEDTAGIDGLWDWDDGNGGIEVDIDDGAFELDINDECTANLTLTRSATGFNGFRVSGSVSCDEGGNPSVNGGVAWVTGDGLDQQLWIAIEITTDGERKAILLQFDRSLV